MSTFTLTPAPKSGFRSQSLTSSLLLSFLISTPLLISIYSLVSEGEGWLGQQGEERYLLSSLGRALALRAFGSGPQSQLSHLLSLWPGTDFTTLSFCFLTCEMGIITFRTTVLEVWFCFDFREWHAPRLWCEWSPMELCSGQPEQQYMAHIILLTSEGCCERL